MDVRIQVTQGKGRELRNQATRVEKDDYAKGLGKSTKRDLMF